METAASNLFPPRRSGKKQRHRTSAQAQEAAWSQLMGCRPTTVLTQQLKRRVEKIALRKAQQSSLALSFSERLSKIRPPQHSFPALRKVQRSLPALRKFQQSLPSLRNPLQLAVRSDQQSLPALRKVQRSLQFLRKPPARIVRRSVTSACVDTSRDQIIGASAAAVRPEKEPVADSQFASEEFVAAYWPDGATWLKAYFVQFMQDRVFGRAIEVTWVEDGSRSVLPVDHVRKAPVGAR